MTYIKEHTSKEMDNISETRKIKIYTAANLYINVTPSSREIAKAINVDIKVFREWRKTDEWKEALQFWGFTGKRQNPTRRIKLPPPEVPFTLTEKYLLEKAFPKEGDIRLVTYNGLVDTQIKAVDAYDIILPDNTRIDKIYVLLAFPKINMQFVTRGTTLNKHIAEQKLLPILKVSERHQFSIRAKIGDIVECTMRNGLVVVGRNIWISKYNLVLRVGGQRGRGGKVVIVYKHAIHEFKILIPALKTPARNEKDKTNNSTGNKDKAKQETEKEQIEPFISRTRDKNK